MEPLLSIRGATGTVGLFRGRGSSGRKGYRTRATNSFENVQKA